VFIYSSISTVCQREAAQAYSFDAQVRGLVIEVEEVEEVEEVIAVCHALVD
jgi:hypothetical protein